MQVLFHQQLFLTNIFQPNGIEAFGSITQRGWDPSRALRAVPAQLLSRLGPPSAPGPVQQLHLGQSLGDHGGKDQPEEDAADQHIVVVILEHVKLLGGVHPRLEDVQPVGYNLQGRDQELGMDAAWSIKPHNDPLRVTVLMGRGDVQAVSSRVMGVTEVPATGIHPQVPH